MSLADLAYVQQILEETFDDIWTSPAQYQFEVKRDIPAWALEARTLPRADLDALAPERDLDEPGDEPLQIDEYSCHFSVSPVLISYKGELI
ncbi:hypothetical protein [Caballeronia cordobensis]|uniref:hypothetical protein n=1 Tax=Caballeronia cordobensis TaxID=1353886 RepID=UPI0006AD6525|nr:hypothetical protein [Caballeronia cordobensis]